MRDDQHRFLMVLRQWPARLNAEQAAWVLNCQAHDVPVLVATRLLKPLGSPAANSTKYFATADLLEQIKDRHWLARVTATIQQHWHRRNTRQQCRSLALDGSRNGPAFKSAATATLAG